MACILKAPSPGSKGVVVFTTPERDLVIFKDKALRLSLEHLKARWALGLHHNWHDYQLKYDPIFDFHMAGEDDLKEITGKHIPLIPMDACNFSPRCFAPAAGEKFWDILYVARAVYFKRIPEFFRLIRTLYDQGKRYRVLLICPVPPLENGNKGAFCNVREEYDKLFSEDEKDLFTLLTIDFRYPFPLDLETLSHFYKSSKVFVHTADDERRCRVTGYAWATGMPVVGMPCIASLLPKQLRKEPFLFEVTHYEEFADATVKALESAGKQYDFTEVRNVVSQDYTQKNLSQYLCIYAGRNDSGNDFNLEGLDIRLGRHHGISIGKNKIYQSLVSFSKYLNERPGELVSIDLSRSDPEIYISGIEKFNGNGCIVPKNNCLTRIRDVLQSIAKIVIK